MTKKVEAKRVAKKKVAAKRASKKAITRFARSKAFEAAFAESVDDYGSPSDVDPTYEWPNSVLSSRTVVYGSGVVARKGEPVEHRVDPTELARCKRIARDAARILRGVSVGMGSESDSGWAPFYQVLNVGEKAPARLSEAWLRARFGGVICPHTLVSVEPLREKGRWWELSCGSFDDEALLAKWRELIGFFRGHEELMRPSIAVIGDSDYVEAKSGTPPKPDDVMHGSVLPRMPFALTHHGSIVGLFGHVVWT